MPPNPQEFSPARPQVKVCCIGSLAEADAALAAGAHALGLVSAMPSGPGVIDEALITAIAAHVAQRRPDVQTFLLTSHTSAEAIVAQHLRCCTTTLQLVDHLPTVELARLRAALPGVRLVQVVHVMGEASIDQAVAAAPWVDAILLDSGNPAALVKELGGTGRTHDWALSGRIRAAVAALGKPLYLAGGLHGGNVAQAVAAVRPYGLDVCSGVRQAGQLDAGRLVAFFSALPALR